MRMAKAWRAGTSLIGVAAVAGTVLLASPAAQAQDTRVIRVGNWVPMHHLIVRGILEPWARAIEAETDGSLKLEIMSSALARPPAYFDLVLDGTIDVGWGVSGHNPGRFTMTQVMDLPFSAPDPWAGAAAAWLTYERYGDRYNEHEGAKVVGLWTHSEPYIHMRGEPIRTVDDLAGQKIRVGGNVTGKIIEALGGTPLQLPPTEAQQAIARGVADGITFPLESIEFFKITPSIKSSTRIPGVLYIDTFWLAFNQDVWDSLTDAQRAAVEKHSGLGVALLSGWAWTNGDTIGEAALRASNVEFVTLPDAEVARIRKTLVPLEEEWLAEADSRGLPGEEILGYSRAIAQQYKREKKVNIP